MEILGRQKWIVGAIRSLVSDPIMGLGTEEAMPATFYGNEYGQSTGIQITSVEFDKDPEGMEAPNSFMVTPVVAISGTRDSGRIFKITDYDIRYTLTFSDDSTIPYDNYLVDSETEIATNPYEDFGVTGKFELPMKEDYKLTIEVRAASSTIGMCWKHTYTYTFSTLDHAGTRIYYDATNGSSSNDGKDGLGIGLTSATYTESTGYITQTGAFAGVTLTTEVNPYESNRFLYVTVDGIPQYVELESIVDANSAKVKDNYKFGADKTGITSSTGAKAESDFDTAVLYNSGFNGYAYFLSGQNSDIYNRTAFLRVRGVRDHTMVAGYGGTPTIRSSDTTRFVLEGEATTSSSIMFEEFYLGNIILDGEETHGCLIVNTSSNTESTNRFITNRVQLANNGDDAGLYLNYSNANKDISWLDFCSSMNNKYTNVEALTINVATAGSGTFTVNEVIPSNVSQGALIKIVDGGTTHWYLADSWTGSTFTLVAGRDPNALPSTLRQTYTSGAAVTVHDPKSLGALVYTSHIGLRGTIWNCDGTESTYDHDLYPSLHNPYFASRGFYYMCDMRSLADGLNKNFVINLNNDSGTSISRLNISRNFGELNCARGLIEGGNAVNRVENGWFEDVYMYGNGGQPSEYAIFPYVTVSCLIKASKFSHPTGVYRGFVTFEEGSTNEGGQRETWNDYEWDWVIHDNIAYGYNAFTTQNSNENPAIYPELAYKYLQKYVDYRDNNTWSLHDGTTKRTVNIGISNAYADSGSVIFTGNNLYAPNQGSTPYEVDDINYNLSGFNTQVSGINTADMPQWADPANFNFSIGTPVADFNAATPTYITVENTNLATAYYTHTSQYVVRLYFNTTSTGSAQRFTDGAPSGGYNALYAQCGIQSDDTLYYGGQVLDATVDGGSSISNGADFSAYLDGADHYIDIKIQTGGRVGSIGLAASGTGGFDGTLWGLQFIQFSDSSVLYSFPLETVKLDTETQTSGDVTITFNGFGSGDWTTR